MVENRSFSEFQPTNHVVLENSSGKKVGVYRYLNIAEAFNDIDVRKKQQLAFKRMINQNKNRRLLDNENLLNGLSGGKKKTEVQALNPRRKLIDGDIERELIEKHCMKPAK